MADPFREDRASQSVNTAEAVGLIGGAIPRRAGTWADLGAGDSAFTPELVELLGQSSSLKLSTESGQLQPGGGAQVLY